MSKRRKGLFIERQEKWCGGQGTGALGVSQSLELDRTGAFDCFDWAGRSRACRSVLPFLSVSLMALGWGLGRDTPVAAGGRRAQVGGDGVSREQRGMGPPRALGVAVWTRP